MVSISGYYWPLCYYWDIRRYGIMGYLVVILLILWNIGCFIIIRWDIWCLYLMQNVVFIFECLLMLIVGNDLYFVVSLHSMNLFKMQRKT